MQKINIYDTDAYKLESIAVTAIEDGDINIKDYI